MNRVGSGEASRSLVNDSPSAMRNGPARKSSSSSTPGKVKATPARRLRRLEVWGRRPVSGPAVSTGAGWASVVDIPVPSVADGRWGPGGGHGCRPPPGRVSLGRWVALVRLDVAVDRLDGVVERGLDVLTVDDLLDRLVERRGDRRVDGVGCSGPRVAFLELGEEQFGRSTGAELLRVLCDGRARRDGTAGFGHALHLLGLQRELDERPGGVCVAFGADRPLPRSLAADRAVTEVRQRQQDEVVAVGLAVAVELPVADHRQRGPSLDEGGIVLVLVDVALGVPVLEAREGLHRFG